MGNRHPETRTLRVYIGGLVHPGRLPAHPKGSTMTAPVDPTPYLLATGLRTAEDAARWLAERAEDEPRATAWCLHDRFTARLDRERRQACRRGALESWRRVADLVRFARQYRNRDRGWDAHGHGVWHYLSRALAFRAAARQP